MEGEYSSWVPTLWGLVDDLKVALFSFLDAKSTYCLGLTCTKFLNIVKSPSLGMHKKLFKLVEDVMALEDLDNAFKIINSCLLLFPRYSRLWKKKAQLRGIKLDFIEMIKDLRKAYEMCTSESYRHIIMSDIHLATNEPSERNLAMAEIQKAIALKPKSLTYEQRRIFASSVSKMSLYQKVKAYLQLIEDGYKRQDQAYYTAGYLRFAMGEFSYADKYLSKALELNPQYVSALDTKADMSLGMDKISEAFEARKGILKLNPRHSASYRVLAIIHFGWSEFDEALECIEKSWKYSDRLDQQVLATYFVILDQLGHLDNIIEEVDKAIEYYRMKLKDIADEISKVVDDELMLKAAARKRNAFNVLLYHALKWKVLTDVFLGELHSAAKLYDEVESLKDDEDDQFFSVLFRSTELNIDYVTESKEIVTKMARTNMALESDRQKFLEQIHVETSSSSDIAFLVLCVLKKTKVRQLHQTASTALDGSDALKISAYMDYICRVSRPHQLRDVVEDHMPY